jgi:hypothetical protein
MSHEDRIAINKHCEGIAGDLQPANHRERWLVTSIAEDQWRLNRARALESNIFALGISNPTIEIEAGSQEANAAISQAQVWLADGKKLQMLALYEQRIRRSNVPEIDSSAICSERKQTPRINLSYRKQPNTWKACKSVTCLEIKCSLRAQPFVPLTLSSTSRVDTKPLQAAESHSPSAAGRLSSGTPHTPFGTAGPRREG